MILSLLCGSGLGEVSLEEGLVPKGCSQEAGGHRCENYSSDEL